MHVVTSKLDYKMNFSLVNYIQAIVCLSKIVLNAEYFDQSAIFAVILVQANPW